MKLIAQLFSYSVFLLLLFLFSSENAHSQTSPLETQSSTAIEFGGINLGQNPLRDRVDKIRDNSSLVVSVISKFNTDASKNLGELIRTQTEAVQAIKCTVAQTDTTAPDCLKQMEKQYDTIKTNIRLAQTLDIFANFGLANSVKDCVHADLGIIPHLKAKGAANLDNGTDQGPQGEGTRDEGDKSDGGLGRALSNPNAVPVRLDMCIGNGPGNIKWRVQSKSGQRARISLEDQQRFPPVYFKSIPEADQANLEGITPIIVTNDEDANLIRRGDLTPLKDSPLKDFIDNYYCKAVRDSGLKEIDVCGV